MLEPATPPTPAEERALLEPLAARLIWWQPAQESLCRPERVIAQVMELGDYEAVLQLRRALGDRRLCQVLRQAEPGWFSPRSWTYWHRKLGLTPSGPVPPLPQRRLEHR